MIIPLFILRLLFIIPIILIGVCTSYSDIRFGKIKNIYLKIGFIYICCLYIFLLFYSIFWLKIDNSRYLLMLLLNGLLAFIIGFLLWRLNLWAAGDAKLLIFYSLLIPLEFYTNNYIPYFPALVVLIDTIFFITIFLLFELIIRFIRSLIIFLRSFNFKQYRFLFPKIKDYLFNYLTHKNLKHNIIQAIFFFIFLSNLLIIMQFFQKEVNIIFSNGKTFLFLLYLSFWMINLLLFKFINKYKFVQHILVLLGVSMDIYLLVLHQLSFLLLIWKQTLIMIGIFGIGFQFIIWYLEHKDIKTINVNNLKEGMCLTQSSIEKIKNIVSENKLYNSQQWYNSDGLTKKQVEAIKSICQQHDCKTIEIYTTFPFAPFLFLATVTLLITKHSIFLIFMGVIKQIL